MRVRLQVYSIIYNIYKCYILYHLLGIRSLIYIQFLFLKKDLRQNIYDHADEKQNKRKKKEDITPVIPYCWLSPNLQVLEYINWLGLGFVHILLLLLNNFSRLVNL